MLGFLRRTHSAKQSSQSGELESSKVSEDSAYQQPGAAPDRGASADESKSSEQQLAGLHLGGTAAVSVGDAPPSVPEEHGLQASDFGHKAGA